MATKLMEPEKVKERRLSRVRPFETLPGIFDEMERFWDLSFGRPWKLFRTLGRPMRWTPTVDIFHKEGELVVQADLPGLKKDEVEVSLEEGDLVIKGERKIESKVEEENYYRMERAEGKFYRRMPLPEGVKPDQIKAEFKDGVLNIRVPLPAAMKHKVQKISVR